MKMFTATPSYGRDYTNQKALKADWKAGKDFTFNHMGRSTQFSIRDVANLIADGFTQIQFRYKKQTQIMMLKLV